MSEDFSHSDSNDRDQQQASGFPTRREIMRERRLREAEEARKEQRRIARQKRREAESQGRPAERRPTQPPLRDSRAPHRASPQCGRREQSPPIETYDPLTTGTRSRRVEVERARVRKRRRSAKIRTGVTIVGAAVILVCVYTLECDQ